MSFLGFNSTTPADDGSQKMPAVENSMETNLQTGGETNEVIVLNSPGRTNEKDDATPLVRLFVIMFTSSTFFQDKMSLLTAFF